MFEQPKPLRPPQQIKGDPNTVEEEMTEEDELAVFAAQKYNLHLPRVGTPIFKRIVETAIEYARRVDYQETSVYISSLATGDNRRQIRSDKERRALHNTLCQLLLNKEHADATPQERDRLSNFAVTIAKMEKYLIE